MDEQQQRVNEAAQKYAEALAESYRAVSERSVSVQQLNTQLMQDFFSALINNLRAQTEETLGASQELTEQTRRGQEAAQMLARESAEVYVNFMHSMFSPHRGSRKEAERSVEE